LVAGKLDMAGAPSPDESCPDLDHPDARGIVDLEKTFRADELFLNILQ
jgi:hypothetical protein